MPDREYRIRIITTSEGQGVTRATGEMEGLTKQTEKLEISHRDLREAIRETNNQFPEFAHIARAALNPVSLGVAGLVGAFEIFKNRLEETTKLFSGLEVNESPFANIWKADAMTKALIGMADAVRQVGEAYKGVDASSDREAKRFEAEVKALRELLQLRQDNLGLIQAEADAERVRIEMDRAKAERLERDSQAKIAAAGKIHVPTAEDDQARLAELKQAADKAQQTVDEIEATLAKVNTFDELTKKEQIALSAEFASKYGYTDPKEVMAQLVASRSAAYDTIALYERRLKGSEDRDALRKEKEGLLGQAGKEATEAETIQAGLGDRASDLNRAQALRYRTEQLGMGRQPTVVGGTILGNIEAMEALAHGRAITPEQLGQMDQMVAAMKQNNSGDIVLRVVQEMFNLQMTHNQKFEDIYRMIYANRQMIKSGYNP